ncbi:MAG: hypothetical protein EOM59_08440 [Clostridia bacterium]|nr:hypothetical protein [Clostridia bacterium]
MKKKSTILIVTIGVMAALTYMFIGNPVVMMNNKNLQREVTAVHSGDVALNDLVPFEWDIVYTFDPYTTQEQIESIIGFKSNSIQETVSEGMVQLLFVKGKRVVSSVCGYSQALGYRIDFLQNVSYIDHAVFSADTEAGIVKLTHKERGAT